MNKRVARVLFLAATFILLGITGSPAKEFYQGKIIRILVPYPPGGGYDIHSRLLARHLGAHIPGNPRVIVQNMPGGGGIIAPNYLYNVAKQDGTVISILGRNVYVDQLIGTKGVKFDLTKMRWVGNNTDDTSVGYMLTNSPYTSIEAIRAAKRPPNIGYSGTGSSYYQFPRLLNYALDTNIKLIGGYAGTSPIKLAMARGELDGILGIGYFSAVSALADELKAGTLKPIIQSGVWDPKSSGFVRHPDLADVPTVWELTPDATKRKIIKLMNTADVISRPFIAPPNIPEDRLKLLRDGFWATVTSAAFRKDAKQLFGMFPRPSRGEFTEGYMREVLAASPEDVAALKKLLE
jgi:tripartite-type tricarboxylate transporter receptor subunit TctC